MSTVLATMNFSCTDPRDRSASNTGGDQTPHKDWRCRIADPENAIAGFLSDDRQLPASHSPSSRRSSRSADATLTAWHSFDDHRPLVGLSRFISNAPRTNAQLHADSKRTASAPFRA